MRTRGRPRGGYLPDEQRKPALKLIKERHRLIAKYIAAGLSRYEIAARMDMTPERIGQLMLDPAMKQLARDFESHPQVRDMIGMDDIALLRSISVQNAIESAIAMRDNLHYYDQADERMPVREAARIFELSSDRVGFGKHTHNTNVNIDFATQLDLAIDRSRQAKTISGSVQKPMLPAPSVREKVLAAAPTLTQDLGLKVRTEPSAPTNPKLRRC